MPSPRRSGVRFVPDSNLREKVNESFDDLTEAYPLMYRIFSDRSHCRLDEDGFIAPPCETQPISQSTVRMDVAREIHWGKTSYIATSLSLTYIIQEANRRQKQKEKNIKIAFIRTSDFLHGRAFVALNELPLPKGDDENLMFRRFANLQQTVLVKESIPKMSIVHVIGFQDLVNNLPKYFLRDGALDLDETPDNQVRNASRQFWANFERGTQGRKGMSEMDARIAQGSKIAMELIIRPQLEEVDFLRTVQGGFNDFIEKSGAMDVAIEFAHFPCPDSEEMAINNHKDLHSEANKDRMKTAMAYEMLLECMKKVLKDGLRNS